MKYIKPIFFESNSVAKKHGGVADCSLRSMGTVSVGEWAGTVPGVIS